jgi:hypothetical protein
MHQLKFQLKDNARRVLSNRAQSQEAQDRIAETTATVFRRMPLLFTATFVLTFAAMMMQCPGAAAGVVEGQLFFLIKNLFEMNFLNNFKNFEFFIFSSGFF